jgi:hypothetical protein
MAVIAVVIKKGIADQSSPKAASRIMTLILMASLCISIRMMPKDTQGQLLFSNETNPGWINRRHGSLRKELNAGTPFEFLERWIYKLNKNFLKILV